MTTFADALPPGPKVPDYDFTVVYYVDPYGGKYRDQVAERLKAGMSVRVAIAGIPVSMDTGYKIRKSLGLTRKDEKPEYKIFGMGKYDGFDLVEMYTVKKMSLKQIGKVIGMGKSGVYRILKKLGVDIRSKIEAARLTKRLRSKPKNNPLPEHRNPHRNAKLAKWRENYGPRYLPVYEDIAKGMSIFRACKKHGVNRKQVYRHFRRLQTQYLAYLDFGPMQRITIPVTRERLNQWEWVAKQSQLNVLDWIKQTLNRHADKKDNVNARNKPRTH